MFTFDLAQKLSSSLLSVEWSHSGYVTTCFINSLVAVLWEQRIKLTSPVRQWHTGACVWCGRLCCGAPGCDTSSWFVPPFEVCEGGAVSAYSWQVAAWNPLLFRAAEMLEQGPEHWWLASAAPCLSSTSRLWSWFLTYFQLCYVKSPASWHVSALTRPSPRSPYRLTVRNLCNDTYNSL